MNLGEGLGPLGFEAQVQCAALIGSSGASSTSTVHPADYNRPFHGWTKTDGGAGSAIHPCRRVMMWGEENGILSKSADTKTSGFSSSSQAISAYTKPHSKAPWLGDLRVNNTH